MAFSVGNETFQVYLTSDGCLDKFPENKPSNFKISLNSPKEFRNPNQKSLVGLARFGYDSALYNLGPNTGTSIHLFVSGKYFEIETPKALVLDAVSASSILNAGLVSFSNQMGLTDNKTLEKYLNFSSVSSEQVQISLKNVDDFAISPMLRKLLGFHSEESKLASENFIFRKQCRDFLSEISNSATLLEDLEQIEVQYPTPHGLRTSKSFAERNEFMKPFKLNIEQFFHQTSDDLESILQNLVKDQKNELEEFIAKNYYFSASKNVRDSFVFFSEETKNQVTIPFSVWSMAEFIIHSLGQKSFRVGNLQHIVRSNTNFNPQLFNCLYVYSNIVKPVDFNDKKFRLLDIVFLKPTTFHQPGVIEHQSTQFKNLDTDTVNEIQILVTTSLGLPAPFIHGPVFVILEFRKQ